MLLELQAVPRLRLWIEVLEGLVLQVSRLIAEPGVTPDAYSVFFARTGYFPLPLLMTAFTPHVPVLAYRWFHRSADVTPADNVISVLAHDVWMTGEPILRDFQGCSYLGECVHRVTSHSLQRPFLPLTIRSCIQASQSMLLS